MSKITKQTFDHLSPGERAVVGAPDDYDWAGATSVAQSARPSVTQFSLRVDRALLRQLQVIAHARGTTVSEVARESLERYVQAGGRPAAPNIQVSFKPDTGLLVQVEGGRAELAVNRRTASVDERVSAGAIAPTTY
jgi:hypothetical protein